MEGLGWTNLTAAERNDFLDTGGAGALTFATESDDPLASLTVSYGYYAEAEAFYFRLSFPPRTHKPDIINNLVSFVTDAKTDHGRRSVVATGVLQELADVPYESVAVQGMWAVNILTILDQFSRRTDRLSNCF
ncbi:pyridoxamine 5'-phosphate oxidase family protein [Halostagnicola bangensis]